jgi:hypothetical protein
MAKDINYLMTTTLDVDTIAQTMRSTLGQVTKNVEFIKLNTIGDPFTSIDRLAFAVLATGKDGLLKNKQWGVKTQIYDDGSVRTVLLGVIASSFMDLATASFAGRNFWESSSNVKEVDFKKGPGKEKAELIIDALRRLDPKLSMK